MVWGGHLHKNGVVGGVTYIRVVCMVWGVSPT